MNIFYLHEDPREAARMQCDKHVVKMILESAQMLSTAHRVLDGYETKIPDRKSQAILNWLVPEARKNFKPRMVKHWVHPELEYEEILYKATHSNHPSNVWTRESSANYMWLLQHFYGLCKEYTFRYGRTHASETKLAELLWTRPLNEQTYAPTEVKLAMPDEFKCQDPVKAYRDYYISKQKDVKMVWTKRPVPEWFCAA